MSDVALAEGDLAEEELLYLDAEGPMLISLRADKESPPTTPSSSSSARKVLVSGASAKRTLLLLFPLEEEEEEEAFVFLLPPPTPPTPPLPLWVTVMGMDVEVDVFESSLPCCTLHRS